MKTFILLVCASLAAATGGPGARCRPAVTITETVVLSTITTKTETETETKTAFAVASSTGAISSAEVPNVGGGAAAAAATTPAVIVSIATAQPISGSTHIGAPYGNGAGTVATPSFSTETECSSVFPPGWITKASGSLKSTAITSLDTLAASTTPLVPSTTIGTSPTTISLNPTSTMNSTLAMNSTSTVPATSSLLTGNIIPKCSLIPNAICTRPNDTSGDWNDTLAMKPVGLAATQSIASFLFSDSTTFAHPGMLHTEADFARIREKVNASVSPWIEGFNLLSINDHAKTSWPLNPQVNVYRGYDGIHAENYAALYNDIAAAYQNALMWKITGDESHATFAARILDAWSSTMKFLGGTDDSQLAAGLYGYEFAQAAEIMRTYNGWPVANQTRFGTLLTSIFYPISYDFLIRHNNAGDSIYWANWDLCNIAGILSIGIFTDNTTMANQALDYFLTGPGTGRLNRTIWTTYMVGSQLMGQGQEASRDQGHSTLEFSLLGVIAQTAWNQGIDLFGYADNLILAGSEYTSKYNVGFDVPFTYLTAEMFNTPGFTFPMTVIGNASRGDVRPYGELLRAHYGDLKGLNTTWTDAYVEYVNNNTIQQGAAAGVEGGGGNYGPNSGGYDQLGFGTLMFRLKA